MPSIAAISDAFGPYGLMLRGGFDFDDGENAPDAVSGRPARSALLVGHAGDGFWPHFQAWLKGRAVMPADPLDTWSREVIGEVATSFGARAVSPSDRPYLPFQQWAMRAEKLSPSPLGILMHPQYGLWHAYRGALLFGDGPVTGKASTVEHPCENCAGRPCLGACPVGAFSRDGYDAATCRSHVNSSMDCAIQGCHARNACPVGGAYRYRAEVQRFHMKAFAAA